MIRKGDIRLVHNTVGSKTICQKRSRKNSTVFSNGILNYSCSNHDWKNLDDDDDDEEEEEEEDNDGNDDGDSPGLIICIIIPVSWGSGFKFHRWGVDWRSFFSASLSFSGTHNKQQTISELIKEH